MKTALTSAALALSCLLAACAENAPAKRTAQKADFERGMRVYQATCGVCHESGRNGAPSLEDVEEWDERSLEWTSLMKDHVTHGFMGMTAQGGRARLSEQDIADALYYMTIKIRAEEN
ncbi:cytochrome c5 family protein [Methylococcus sp. EFPC2]|uniref:c-type cytochrome n=1 Tax=Methylococcus sp. EFPC2 TaxID=2812648 RepID=UPI00196811E6|nr:c-type cytochrome [Methylococcus sp. EFPC2]QSA97561.1 cytochrome c5 family protein [Methylococcus sp. EFPC2]